MTASASDQHARDTERGLGFERLVFFSDAIFAIAITLLVLELHVPEHLGAAGLQHELFALWPKFASFLLSFLAVGLFWMSHHRIFDYIERYDFRLLWLNLLLLLSIAFLPFPTALVGQYGDQRAATIVYGVDLAVAGILQWAVGAYAALGHRLVNPRLDPRFIRVVTRRMLIPPVLALLSIAVAFISPRLAYGVWGLSVALTVVPQLVAPNMGEYERRYATPRPPIGSRGAPVPPSGDTVPLSSVDRQSGTARPRRRSARRTGMHHDRHR